MTVDEALRLIGVAPGSSPEEIRRAWLRKTRTWNPASDPDGLQRLREAHDLLVAEHAAQPPSYRPRAQPAAPPPGFTEAFSRGEPPVEMDAWLAKEPVVEDGSSAGRWIAILGGGAVLFLGLWFGISRYQNSDQGRPVGSPMESYMPALPPSFAGYASSRDALNEICLAPNSKQRDFCNLATSIAQAAAQHKCSDAKAGREKLEKYIVVSDVTLGQVATRKIDSLKENLDKEIAACWKFWNP